MIALLRTARIVRRVLGSVFAVGIIVDRDNPNDSFTENGQNSEKSPGIGFCGGDHSRSRQCK